MVPTPAYPTGSFWWMATAQLRQIAAAARDADLKREEDTVSAMSRGVATYTVMDGGTAVVDLVGPMEKRASLFGSLFGMASTETAAFAVRAAVADPDVRSILLRIDSPGGSVDGLAELGDAVYAARKSKRVIAQVDGMAASAAYYVAAQADKVYAGRMDLVGSIGAYLLMYDLSKAYENEGIEPVLITNDGADQKGIGEPGVPITEQQRESAQKIVDAFGADFRRVVARGRGMSTDAVRELATGELFMAKAAVANGLIDGIQPMEQTLAATRPRTRRRTAESSVALMD